MTWATTWTRTRPVAPAPTAAPSAVPPRVLQAVAGRDYTCEPCQVRGHGTHCWYCGTRIGAPA